VTYRLVGFAEDRIDAVLLESARSWSIEAAGRYHRLMLAAAAALGDTPTVLRSRAIERVPGVRAFHLRAARGHVPADDRVAEPRHLLVYRVAPDGIVEILGIVHDRMHPRNAARRARRAAARDNPLA
jgi:toxin ParE1/3/4